MTINNNKSLYFTHITPKNDGIIDKTFILDNFSYLEKFKKVQISDKYKYYCISINKQLFS